MKIFRAFAHIPLLIMAIFALLACDGQSRPKGIVATVNGESITLHEVQTFIDSRSASLGIPPRPSLDDMLDNYGNAVATLIAHALVRQELRARGIAVSDHDFARALLEINKDHGDGGLDKFLNDASLRKDDWLALLRDYLSLEVFKNRVLLPDIKIELEEIKNFYGENKKNFLLPETFEINYATADSEAALIHWCENMDEPDGNVLVQRVDASLDELPPEWREAIRKLKEGKCAKPRAENGQWRVAALLKKNKAGITPLSEVYALVENILASQKRDEAFNNWLKRKVSESRIYISSELNHFGARREE